MILMELINNNKLDVLILPLLNMVILILLTVKFVDLIKIFMDKTL